MIELHKDSESDFMLKQYQDKKLKLSGFLFEELLTNTDSRSEVMYLIKIFIEKFYQQEIKNHQRFKKEDYLRSEEHTSELQSRPHLVCRLLLEKKKKKKLHYKKKQ